ncbi:MAG: DUF4231 domain-containing protein [Paraburkholderia sp.]|uniref:DUF4231 domain-containing protein n=1 Tax=Burkholderiaceae TaxID=119060 RepID=UPI0010F86289|nr:DUF4231 domain-containing protein [Burkholderia sp. 4M9327F10]
MDPAFDLMWRQYRGWAMRAAGIRSNLDRWRLITLGLTVGGALVATLASQLPSGANDVLSVARVLSLVSAASMAAASWTARTMLDPMREKQWIRARALAERAKSESYRYATHSAPYDGPDGAKKLFARIDALTSEGQDVPPCDLTDEEASRNKPASTLSVEDYAVIRVEQEITGFFEPNAAANERHGILCTRAVQTLSLLSALLAVIGASMRGMNGEAWVAVLSTVSASIGSYAMAKRYQRLAATYRLAAERLRRRKAEWEFAKTSDGDPAADESFVSDAENILNGENQTWATDFLTQATATPKPVATGDTV